MFHPWIGTEYSSTRLLILGESAFSWWEEDELRQMHSIESVSWAIDKFPDCGRFLGIVSRGLSNNQTPSRERLTNVWNRVAFTNYVSATVGDGARVQPTTAMWEDAKRDFLPQITKQFDPTPRRVIVLGKRMWARMPNSDVHITDDVQGYNLTDGLMMCWATHHPAGGLSWRELASIIHFTYNRELQA